MPRRSRSITTRQPWAGICALCGLAAVLAACAKTSTEPDQLGCDAIRDAISGSTGYDFQVLSGRYPASNVGIETNYDADLNLIYMGPSSVGEDTDSLAALTVFFNEPYSAGGGTCVATYASATLSTSDARVGTADELNGKYFQLYLGGVDPCRKPGLPSDRGSVMELTHISQNAIAGEFCISMRQVTYSPAGAPVYEPAVEVVGTFTIINPVL